MLIHDLAYRSRYKNKLVESKTIGTRCLYRSNPVFSKQKQRKKGNDFRTLTTRLTVLIEPLAGGFSDAFKTAYWL